MEKEATKKLLDDALSNASKCVNRYIDLWVSPDDFHKELDLYEKKHGFLNVSDDIATVMGNMQLMKITDKSVLVLKKSPSRTTLSLKKAKTPSLCLNKK